MKKITIFLCAVLLICACKKEDEFLNAKPNQSLIIPTSLNDYEALINNDGTYYLKSPSLGAATSEEYFVRDDNFDYLDATEDKNIYTFSKTIFDANKYYGDWSGPYYAILNCNVVLDGLTRLKGKISDVNQYNRVKGAALFWRAYFFFNLLQDFSKPYNPATAKTDLGIPLRLTSNINVKYPRATVQEGYDKVISDLKESLTLLPNVADIQVRPSKLVANAMLARVYLSLSMYEDALKYANASLAVNNTLTDYNLITNPTVSRMTLTYLSEDLFHATSQGKSLITFGFYCEVNPELLSLYDANDLRKTLFFVDYYGQTTFRGSYDFLFSAVTYSGLANDEIYLTRAECYARSNQADLAIKDLNTLLVKRFKQGTFVPLTATNADDALRLVLVERRKELCFRGLRWLDLRRLNFDDRFKVTLSHTVHGVTYTLPPNDLRYAMPIPDDEIKLTGIPQNER